MPLQSDILKGSVRLEQTMAGGPPVKRYPPADDPDAVGRIQKALVALGVSPMPRSFPNGPTGEPDGKFGSETYNAVIKFQKQVFPSAWQEWDGRVGKKTLEQMDALLPKTVAPPPPTTPPKSFIIHDVRLFGWKPSGDVVEVNGDTPLQWLVDCTIARSKLNSGNLILKIMSHGLPGFVQCCRGAFLHPTLQDKVVDPAKGNLFIGPGKGGISIADLNTLSQLKGQVKRIEFHSCLVARIGTCHEANGHTCYDGNAFCFRLAQVTQAEVKASIHLQYYWKGTGPGNGIHFGKWNGRVFTWGPAGNIVAMEDFPYKEMDGPPPPGTQPT
jgi:peptidoglycan hydrolase-like protein with peptidoglycan-binding domain